MCSNNCTNSHIKQRRYHHPLILLLIHPSTEVDFSTWNLYSICPLLQAQNPFLEPRLQHTFTHSVNTPMSSQLLDVGGCFLIQLLQKCVLCKEDQFLRQLHQDSPTTVSFLLSYMFCNSSCCSGPRNAIYTRMQGAACHIHTDVPALEKLQNKTVYLFVIHCKWCNIPYSFSSDKFRNKERLNLTSEFEACVSHIQVFERDNYPKSIREDLNKKRMQ